MFKMNHRFKKLAAAVLGMGMLFSLVGCGGESKGTTTATTTASSTAPSTKKVELTILAAASLTDVCNELKGIYEGSHAGVTLTYSYAGSGALQTQIEEGAPADVFISAAKKQMNALKEKSLMKEDTIGNLLENKVVLIVPADSKLELKSFEDLKSDSVKMVGIGEVESVPVGQYAKTIFTNLGFWDTIEKKANFGTDVRTVLNWVETGEVDCGVVYATDAYTTDKVKIVAEAPAGSSDPVIYPAGVVAASKNAAAAEEFVTFLKSEEAMKVFEKYGFSRAGE